MKQRRERIGTMIGGAGLTAAAVGVMGADSLPWLIMGVLVIGGLLVALVGAAVSES